MHNLLQLKGNFEYSKNMNNGGGFSLPKDAFVTLSHIHDLKEQLTHILEMWKKDTLIEGALISVHYTRIIPKSRRLQYLLAEKGKKPNDSVRGAKFEWNASHDKQNHVFTHYLSLEALQKSISILNQVETIFKAKFGEKITDQNIANLKSFFNKKDQMAPSSFGKVVCDCFSVNYFDIDKVEDTIKQNSIITIYKTKVNTIELLSKLGLKITADMILQETTIRMMPEGIKKLQSRAPYLIAMSVTDFTKLNPDSFEENEVQGRNPIIPKPQNEPIVGVIDTQFNQNVYFSDWVEYHNMLDPEIELHEGDYAHGTAVSSIIVDGPKGNPQLDDGCGRFRVRHFGVATGNRFSSFSIMKMIRTIISENSDIRVWNLSLGSQQEINPSFISPEGAELDALQNEYNIIFVVAGTNKPNSITAESMRIGAPADSLNSIVVNAVSRYKKPALYTRKGPVLSFFHKPDVSYYGGDKDCSDSICVCNETDTPLYVSGTSYAAPWVTRKLAYMIEVLGFSREAAKALLLDATAGWGNPESGFDTIGYGIVPIKISDIVDTQRDDEIRFVIEGKAKEFETYNYNLPIPVIKNKHPFIARATMTYFPVCERVQGVDYTTTEMDLHFGRLTQDNGKTVIKDIQKNTQSEPGTKGTFEEDARAMFRKWDNVKRVCENISPKVRERKIYNQLGLWGISVKTKERILKKKDDGLRFAIVVTLREIRGKDRYDEFIKGCNIRGWIVNSIDIHNRINVYEQAETEIRFE